MGSPGTNIQKWEDWDDESAEEQAKQTEKKGGGDFFKVNGKRAQVRVVPPPAGRGMKTPFVVTYQHFIELVKKNKDATAIFNCPKKMTNGKKRCPACEKADAFYKQADAATKPSQKKALKDKAALFKSKLRVYAAVIDRAKEDDVVIQTFPFGAQIWNQIKELREEVGNFAHPVKGRDLIIKKTGEGFDTEYTTMLATEASPLVEDAKLMGELPEQYPDLLSYATIPTYEECVEAIKKAVKGASGESDADEEEEDERPARKASRHQYDDDDDDDRPAQRRKPRPENDGWDDDTVDTDGESVGDNPNDLFDDD